MLHKLYKQRPIVPGLAGSFVLEPQVEGEKQHSRVTGSGHTKLLGLVYFDANIRAEEVRCHFGRRGLLGGKRYQFARPKCLLCLTFVRLCA
jgi:hypothetical protein